MKKMTKLMIVVTFIIVNILTVFYLDFKQAKGYQTLSGYETESIHITYPGDKETAVLTIRWLQEVANKYHILLSKHNNDPKMDIGSIVYLSVDSTDSLISLLEKDPFISVKKTSTNENGFISTYDHESEKQIGTVRDLFQDHFYTFYIMDDMEDTATEFAGNYFVHYRNIDDYHQFVAEINEGLGYDTQAYGYFGHFENFVGMVVLGSLGFLLLFYFIFQLYTYYNQSQKIGCMRLLGIDATRINRKMIWKTLLLEIVTVVIIAILLLLFVKNLTWRLLGIILGLDIVIIFLTYVLSKIACLIIQKEYKTSNLLKKQNITPTIMKVSYFLKMVMVIVFFLFGVIAFSNASVLFDSLKQYHTSKNLLEYGTFPEFFPFSDGSVMENTKQLCKSIQLDPNIEVLYAYIPEGGITPSQVKEMNMDLAFGSVNRNYLKKQNITVYDLQGNKIDYNTISGVFFLFPKSKQNRISEFEVKYREGVEYLNNKHQVDYTFEAYLYDDREIETYRILPEDKKIDSLILRVIDESVPCDFNSPYGTILYGTGIDTPFKIKADEHTKQLLEKYIEESQMDGVIPISCFVSYQDYFHDQIRNNQILMSALSIIVLVTIVVYSLISFQITRLYITSQRQKVIVKKVLGYDTQDIFSSIYKKSWKAVVISAILAFVLLLLLKQLHMMIFIALFITLLILDFLTIWLSTKSWDLSKIYLDIKGGNHD